MALEEFKKQLEKDPNFPELRNAYGLILIRLGQEAKGFEQIIRARELAPDYSPIRKNLGRLYKIKAEKLKEKFDKHQEAKPETADEEKLLQELRLMMK